MTIKDFGFWIRDFWNDFKKETAGLIGLGILVVAILIVVFEPFLLPWGDVDTKWRDISYWQDNSPSAPPAWTNAFKTKKSAITLRVEKGKHETVEMDGGIKMENYSFEYDFQYDKPPLDLIFHIEGTGDIPLKVSVERPDGLVVDIADRYEQGLMDADIRVSLENDGRNPAFAFLKTHESEEAVASLSSSSIRSTDVIFNTAKPGMITAFTPLRGTYKIQAQALILDAAAFKVQKPYLVVTGSVSGLLGTDNMKRDLFSGVIAGLKWALFIGLLTSVISIILGVMYGIVAAYYGGTIDNILLFIYQIFSGVPVLPVLIVLAAIFKPSIWFLIFVMILFSWPGSVMTVRSMALQIKEETYIEAARALGASHSRIIFKHMTPLLIPYSFASMALAVPGAIVYESSVSLLGLGDPSIVTWGQILYAAQQGSAILNGLWWWIIPPGLLIAVMGMTFAFLGFAMDKILHPKLRTR